MLKLADLRKTTRRAKNGDLRVVYPTLLRDRSLVPRIQMAVRYLESMLSRPRRELDEEVVVQLFGDHKIARCVVACLAASYRHRPRAFAEVLPGETVAHLAERGIAGPSGLRLWLYRRTNRELAGFVGGAERADFLRAAGADLGLAIEQIETLITLDAPANAVLVRTGPVPTAEDVIARFNYETAAALLANAPVVRVALARAPADAATLRALCQVAGIHADLGSRELVLHGRQDALNGWARNGAKLVRLLAALLACGLPARGAEAIVAAPMGGEWLFRLDADALADLGARPVSGAAPAYDASLLLDCWRQAEAFAADFAALRRAGEHAGWTLRRATEPVIVQGAVLPALFACSRGNQRVPLALAPASAAEMAAVASVASRIPLIALATSPEVATALRRAGIPALSYAGRSDLAALPSLLARAVGEVDARAEVARVESAFEEARRAGVVTELHLAELLGCNEEELPLRLAMPAARAARERQDVQYIEGFGLCTSETLERARAATAEVDELRAGQSVGQAWLVRQLGRRLRAVTGASEGIECLIAYLGAA
jgi:Protein of unknown function (DUF790)